MRALRIKAGTLVRNITIELAPFSPSGSDSASLQRAGWLYKAMIRPKKTRVISKVFMIKSETT
jgi:hypothetical protein